MYFEWKELLREFIPVKRERVGGIRLLLLPFPVGYSGGPVKDPPTQPTEIRRVLWGSALTQADVSVLRN